MAKMNLTWNSFWTWKTFLSISRPSTDIFYVNFTMNFWVVALKVIIKSHYMSVCSLCSLCPLWHIFLQTEWIFLRSILSSLLNFLNPKISTTWRHYSSSKEIQQFRKVGVPTDFYFYYLATYFLPLRDVRKDWTYISQ